MNDFKRILELNNDAKERLYGLYDDLDNEIIKKGLEICGFDDKISHKIAILRRICDLRDEAIEVEFKNLHFNDDKIAHLKNAMYQYTRQIHENSHSLLIEKIKAEKILDDFNLAILEGMHKIGVVLNEIEQIWENEVEKNAKIFSKMQNAFEFIRKHSLFQTNKFGKKADRIYALAKFNEINGEISAQIVPYAQLFNRFGLDEIFNKMLVNLKKFAKNDQNFAYIDYFEKLKIALFQNDNNKIIDSWQEAEISWMKCKSELQIGHFLEYYEDNFTHSVALEWDIRLKEQSDFDENLFKNNIKSTFETIFAKVSNDEKMRQNVLCNIEKTQIYISTPLIYYAANLNGLFSAQVVPNDEFVSTKYGKKIFAFVNFVYKNAKAKPFMKISSQIFSQDFLNFGREILFKKPEIWKKVYEISTIGHEFGHILFIDENSENLMNVSGKFKLIEEYKATLGGLVNFFLHEEESLKMPVFAELIKRSVSLIAQQRANSILPYYTECLIHLSLLFKSGVLGFDGQNLSLDFSQNGYEKFKEISLKNYENLAKFYSKKQDCALFLEKFASLKNGIFLPNDAKTREFVEFYYALFEKIGNEIDTNAQKSKWL